MATFGLVCPFLDDDPKYAHGVEFGMLWEQFKTGEPIKGLYLMGNQEQILLALNRLGWRILKVKAHDDCWFWLEAER